MKRRIAFVGFRHPHVFELYDLIRAGGELEIVGVCEEDGPTREQLAREGRVAVTHESFSALLGEERFELLVVGDYFSKRGTLIRLALADGKQIISDKPICTRSTELDEIAGLVADKRAHVGAMLDLRDSGTFRRVRELILNNEIGEVHSIYFNGNHPLLLDRRPQWYFEGEKHGGTINDLGIHAFDLIPWATGESWSVVNAARSWNASRVDLGEFQSAAQVMMTMGNGCGVLGDLSYLVPDSFSYAFPDYWRFVFTGSRGVIQAALNAEAVMLYKNGETEGRAIAPLKNRPGGYLESFLRELDGRPEPGDLTTDEVLSASRTALRCQHAATDRLSDVPLL